MQSQIADMIESGGAADAVPLARRVVERVTAAMLHMDDSSGIIGDDLRMLTALYARACRAAPPDPKQLVAWLVRSRLDGPGWPDIELADFADALGQAGLDEVARLVTERRTAADPDSWAAIGIKFLRQQLAALSGDVDAHVAVLAENLHGARQYGEIVTVLRDAGWGADEERWARRGLAEDPAGYRAGGLREQLAGQVPEEQWLELIGAAGTRPSRRRGRPVAEPDRAGYRADERQVPLPQGDQGPQAAPGRLPARGRRGGLHHLPGRTAATATPQDIVHRQAGRGVRAGGGLSWLAT